MTARSAAATAACSPAPSTADRTSGIHARRACLAAAVTTDCHLAWAFAARSAFHRTMDRSACHGTTASMPSSVAVSAASSSRSPLARAWTRTSRTPGRGSSESSEHVTVSSFGRDGGDRAGQPLAGAVGDVHGLAHGETLDRDRMAGLGSVQDERGTGDQLVQGAWGGEEDRVAHRYRLPSRSRSFAKTPPLAASFPSVNCSPRSLASWRSRSSWAASSLAGRFHLQVDLEVAAAVAAQVRDAEAAQGDDLAGLGAGLDVDLLLRRRRCRG